MLSVPLFTAEALLRNYGQLFPRLSNSLLICYNERQQSHFFFHRMLVHVHVKNLRYI